MRQQAEWAIVTGGSGFIGTAVARALRARGVRVAIVDRNAPQHRELDVFVKGAIEHERTWLALATELAGEHVRALYHFAARTSVLQSVNDPHDVFVSNLVGYENALEFARTHEVASVLFASTNAVVGAGDSGTISERSPLAPLTPYGATKAAGEMLGSAYAASYGIHVASVRLTNVYGPGMWHKDSIVPRLLRHVVGLSEATIYGDGEQVRDFVYIGDVVDAFVRLEELGFVGAVSFGSGTSVSVNELVDLVGDVTGHELRLRHVPAKAGEMPGVSVDLSLARSLGLKADVELAEGLQFAWSDFQEDQGRVAG
ncbi:NAD-dependent epimerase/dehydratase [Acidimicrobium ferrooxidans DSM 10331]|uniref:NAD-dependent epimerase/dehydratase n=1 Tax=Acidimicrobium ferrooxidans (strain DSM 10331 / JCM 15462 / NBRC 103882 / ICP) TaxID=525909 RepID=C7LYZ8_ACIFD|nr:NAD(P)-dependent oxidoreductase [Acidimicrobium ferrooxidans]ACU53956.1 NAD-dependent epimerase/dehydratase [Acidimicrobium ferrooxidans DSM 10331]